MDYLFTAAGFVLLFGGGEFLVRGAVALSRRAGISPLLVGMTVVAFCTSAPELLVSVRSALAGNPDIAVGNVVGSNIANVALILGVATLIKPVRIDRADLRPDALWMVGSEVALVALGVVGVVERWSGAALLLLLATYLIVSYRRELKAGTASTDWHAEETAEYRSKLGVPAAAGLLVAGLAALVVGADLLVRGATGIAASFGVPDAVIGLTVVAIGTSLPELATSVIAAARGHSDVAVGNVFGSNLFNIFAILGTTAVIAPVTISAQIAAFDLPVMLGVGVLSAAWLLSRGSAGRVFGAALTAGYLVYVVWLYVG